MGVRGLGHNLRIVTLVHVMIVLALGVVSGCQWLLRAKPETVIPVEFTVEVPRAAVLEPTPEPAPVQEPEPVPTPEPAPPKPPPKRRRKIEVSRERVRHGDTSRKPSLTTEEIEKLLAQGARPSDRTRIPPDEDARGFARVRAAFYQVWVQPSRTEVGGEAAEAVIVLGPNGRVISGRLSKSSGNAVLDNSVRRALNAVPRVTGLPSGFEQRHREISIAFRVE